MSKKQYTECAVFWRMLYSIGLAQAIDLAPFVFNPHKLSYTPYRCVKCWKPAGTRVVCECAA